MTSLTTRTVALGGGDVTVREWSSDDAGVPLLYWHGLNPFGALDLNEAGPAWAAAGFRVLSFAAPGIADGDALSDLGGYRPTRLADLIVETADHLGVEQFAFVGWSWGASIGVHLAARHADRLLALVLLDAGHTDVPGNADQSLEDVVADFSDEHERYRFDSWASFVGAARETRRRWRSSLEDRFRAGMHESGGAIVARSDRRAAGAAWHGLLQEQPSSAHKALRESGTLVLLVLAEENDTKAEVERFREAVPHVELRRIDSGHDLLADAPDETIDVVSVWLRSIVAGPH